MTFNKKNKSFLINRIFWKLFKLMLLLFIISLIPVMTLRWVDPPVSSFMLQRQWQANKQENEVFQLHYQWVDFHQISPELVLSVIASEDQKFLDHHGFDLESIKQVIKSRGDGGIKRGASTITQQLAKNLFLWPGRSWLRKGLEAYYTIWLEVFLSKQRILELYLNLAEFGDGVYGAQAAASQLYHIPSIGLNRDQSAALAARLPAPKKYRINPPDAHILRRSAWIKQQIIQLGEHRLMDKLYET